MVVKRDDEYFASISLSEETWRGKGDWLHLYARPIGAHNYIYCGTL